MPFPNLQRVVYTNNPIDEVICQLRFPPILRIDAEEVVGFQERLRRYYPLYEEEQPKHQIQIPDDIRAFLGGAEAQLGGKPARRLISPDRNWMVALARDFMSVSTQNYTRWEEFKEHLTRAVKALEEIYAPSFYSRVGLRYRNTIRRQPLNLEHVAWDELLAPYIAAELSTDVAAECTDVKHEVGVRLEIGQVRIRHGFADHTGGEELGYSIDNDFFLDVKTRTDDVPRTIDYFNQQARNTFRWCITDRLHEAMVPEPMAQAG